MTPFEAALLPWEDRLAFMALQAAFHQEHQPQGATELALVNELVWLQWRRRRLMLGERSAHLASLQDRLGEEYRATQTLSRALIGHQDKASKDELADALHRAPEHDDSAVRDTIEDERLTRKGIAILEAGGSYEKALAAVREDTRGWWERTLQDDLANYPDGEPDEGESHVPTRPDAASLLRFLKEDVVPMIERMRSEAKRRPAIRLQAWGESLDPFRAERILAIDERLTRLFAKTLAMLLRLRKLRGAGPSAANT